MNRKPDLREKISLLWIVIMVNMIFNDIYSIILELTEGGILDIFGEAAIILAFAAVLTNIPTVMIYLSRVLPRKTNRGLNIAAAIFTILYVVGGGTAVPHYIIVATIEVILCIVIITIAVRWREES